MTEDAAFAARHAEVIAAVAALRSELTATRLEIKTDLTAQRLEIKTDLTATRTENLANLTAHQAEDSKHFHELRKTQAAISMKVWMASGGLAVLVFGLTMFSNVASAMGLG